MHGIEGKMYMCYFPGCGKTFPTAQYLMDHFPIHGREHTCRACGHGHWKKTDHLVHERHCKGPFDHEEYKALRENVTLVSCDNCGRIFMQAEYAAHLGACNQKFLQKKKGKRHPTQAVVEEGESACPHQGEQTAGLPSMSLADTPQLSQLQLTHGQDPTSTPPPWLQGELPQGLQRVEG